MRQSVPTVEKFMTIAPYCIGPEQTLEEAASLMTKQNIRHLPVLKDSQLLGVVSDRDIQLVSSVINTDISQTPVLRAMSPQPYTVSPESPMDEVAAVMAEKKLGSAVVMKNLKVVGIFTSIDVCRALSAAYAF